MSQIALSPETLRLAGILLLALVTVETGGYYLISLWSRSTPKTAFQIGFARAGHAHAGVLLILSLVGLVYADAAGLDGVAGTLGRSAIPISAILMPAGFFFSSMGRRRERPNAFIWLTYAGSILLAAGLIALGIGLLTA